MTYLNVYLGCVLLFFILAFFIKNVKTYLATGKSVRGRSFKLTISITLSTIIYLIIILKILGFQFWILAESVVLNNPLFQVIGIFLVTSGFVLGLMALQAMKDSWRVGIKYDQKTDLITYGIYKFSRNPYFLSYDLLILGYIFIFPGWILMILYIWLVLTFHLMILEEEKYLSDIHGDEYEQYRKKTARYFSLFK